MASLFKLQLHASKWLGRKCPQNYIIKNPWFGSLILAIIVAAFMIIYKPLGVHASHKFSFEATMVLYCLAVAIPVAFGIKILKVIPQFSNAKEWTIKKELVAIAIILLLMGAIVYFAAFFIEEPSDRWNLKTLINSYVRTLLGVGIPFLLFSLINAPYWYLPETMLAEETHSKPIERNQNPNELINIESKLKKEKLSFFQKELLYVASQGNYVTFYLLKEGKIIKAVIRNSINDIGQQLSKYPRIMRVHRAFIVNVDMVKSMKGNSLGYSLRIIGVDEEIPVSRKNTEAFRTQFKS